MLSFAHSTMAPIRSVGAMTTSDDTDMARTTTLTAGTEVTSLNENGREDGLLSGFQLGAFDFERVRI